MSFLRGTWGLFFIPAIIIIIPRIFLDIWQTIFPVDSRQPRHLIEAIELSLVVVAGIFLSRLLLLISKLPVEKRIRKFFSNRQDIDMEIYSKSFREYLGFCRSSQSLLIIFPEKKIERLTDTACVTGWEIKEEYRHTYLILRTSIPGLPGLKMEISPLAQRRIHHSLEKFFNG